MKYYHTALGRVSSQNSQGYPLLSSESVLTNVHQNFKTLFSGNVHSIVEFIWKVFSSPKWRSFSYKCWSTFCCSSNLIPQFLEKNYFTQKQLGMGLLINYVKHTREVEVKEVCWEDHTYQDLWKILFKEVWHINYYYFFFVLSLSFQARH